MNGGGGGGGAESAKPLLQPAAGKAESAWLRIVDRVVNQLTSRDDYERIITRESASAK